MPHGGRQLMSGGDVLVECWGCQSVQCHWKGCTVSRGGAAMVCDKTGGGWMAVMRGRLGGGDMLVECWGCQSAQCHWKGCKVFLSSAVSRGEDAMVCDKAGGGWMAMMRGRLDPSEGKWCLVRAVYRAFGPSFRIDLAWSVRRWCVVLPPFDLPTFDLFGVVLRGCYHASFGLTCYWIDFDFALPLAVVFRHSFGRFVAQFIGFRRTSVVPSAIWSLPSSYPPSFASFLSIFLVGPSSVRCSFDLSFTRSVGFRGTYAALSGIPLLPSSFPPSSLSVLSRTIHWSVICSSLFRPFHCSMCWSPSYFCRSLGCSVTRSAISRRFRCCCRRAIRQPLCRYCQLIHWFVIRPPLFRPFRRSIHWFPWYFRHSFGRSVAQSAVSGHFRCCCRRDIRQPLRHYCQPIRWLVIRLPLIRPFRRSIRWFSWYFYRSFGCSVATFELSANHCGLLFGLPDAGYSTVISLWVHRMTFGLRLLFSQERARSPITLGFWSSLAFFARTRVEPCHIRLLVFTCFFPQERARSPATLGFWSSLGFFARTAIWGPEEAKVAVMLVMDVLGVVSHQVYSVLGGYSVTWALQCGTDGTVATLRWYYDGTDGTVTGRVEVSRPTCGTVTRQRPD
ncbi:uncharacterized protein G2W53_039648 [Senna tora]|uniref:Uncharacterized protein n=1 Tax=Senna tora TaxID=362788 RepID=A0A834W2Z2_9FABA|nr:uncharacterized protein G2W53_039648 [Senna tora]